MAGAALAPSPYRHGSVVGHRASGERAVHRRARAQARLTKLESACAANCTVSGVTHTVLLAAVDARPPGHADGEMYAVSAHRPAGWRRLGRCGVLLIATHAAADSTASAE